MMGWVCVRAVCIGLCAYKIGLYVRILHTMDILLEADKLVRVEDVNPKFLVNDKTYSTTSASMGTCPYDHYIVRSNQIA